MENSSLPEAQGRTHIKTSCEEGQVDQLSCCRRHRCLPTPLEPESRKAGGEILKVLKPSGGRKRASGPVVGFLTTPGTLVVGKTLAANTLTPQLLTLSSNLPSKAEGRFATIDFEVLPKNPLQAPEAIPRDQFQMHSEQ